MAEPNKGVSEIEKALFEHGHGKIVISNRNSSIKSSVIISDDGVNIVNPNSTGGVFCSKGAVSIQGTLYETSKSTNIRKGEYSENDRTVKIFTFKETVLIESVPKEAAAMLAGQAGANIAQGPVEGIDTVNGMDGVMNLMTDIAAGPKPHVHSISMKHVHRLEPGHLYRIPSVVGFVKSCLSQLTSFLNA